MANYFANVKGITLLQAPRGVNNEGVALVTFDLINQAQNGSGSDTIQLGGGGFNQGVTNTATLATIIQNRLRMGGTITLDAVAPFGLEGVDGTGVVMWAGGSPTISAGNVTSVGMVTAAGGSSAKVTTSANWNAAAGIIVVFHGSVAQ